MEFGRCLFCICHTCSLFIFLNQSNMWCQMIKMTWPLVIKFYVGDNNLSMQVLCFLFCSSRFVLLVLQQQNFLDAQYLDAPYWFVENSFYPKRNKYQLSFFLNVLLLKNQLLRILLKSCVKVLYIVLRLISIVFYYYSFLFLKKHKVDKRTRTTPNL